MNTLNVSCIQHFSTGDGPGIRTTVFLKGCRQRCPWCHNPENIPDEPVTICYAGTGKGVTYGRQTSFDDIFSEVSEDREFYLASGGGVTFSGGEPMLQSKALGELEKFFREDDIHTLIDTAGCVPWDSFSDVIEQTNMFYFDYKTSDKTLYKTVINGDKELILDNLKKLIDCGKNVHARVPLIPGFNMSITECENMCADLIQAGVRFVDLLPFHRLGSSKYDNMGREYTYKDVRPSDKEQISRIKEVFDEHFETIVE